MEVLRLINTFMKKVGRSKYTYSNNDKKWNAEKYWLIRIYWPPSNLQNSSFFRLLFDVDVWVLKYVGAHFPRNLLERKQVNLMVFAINTRNRSNDCIRRNGPKRKYFRYFLNHFRGLNFFYFFSFLTLYFYKHVILTIFWFANKERVRGAVPKNHIFCEYVR